MRRPANSLLSTLMAPCMRRLISFDIVRGGCHGDPRRTSAPVALEAASSEAQCSMRRAAPSAADDGRAPFAAQHARDRPHSAPGSRTR